MRDEVAVYNQARWKALANANALFTRPRRDLDAESARRWIDPDGFLGELREKNVLCLAGGGGQQSAAFALLGASVTVADLSSEQLERDLQAAKEYGVSIKTIQADMRDLSLLLKDDFDVVHQPYSLNFVPDFTEVFRQVKRVLRSGGQYWVAFANPFTMNTRQSDWTGAGYVLSGPYIGGAEVTYDDQDWVYDRQSNEPIQNPVEYRHNLAAIVNALIDFGFSIRHLMDDSDMHADVNAVPGTWDHFVTFAPPWLNILARLDN